MSQHFEDDQIGWFEPEPFEIRMQPPRILLGAENEPIHASVAEGLREQGYDVIQAFDWEQVLGRLAGIDPESGGSTYSLILTDAGLPGTRGLEILVEFKSRSLMTPIVIFTKASFSEAHVMAMVLGASSVTFSPFEEDELLSVVRRIVPPVPLG